MKRRNFRSKEASPLGVRRIAHPLNAASTMGIDSKLRGCDLVALKVRDVCHGDQVASRAVVMQHKTQRTDLTKLLRRRPWTSASSAKRSFGRTASKHDVDAPIAPRKEGVRARADPVGLAQQAPTLRAALAALFYEACGGVVST
jgi:hypothetical protein